MNKNAVGNTDRKKHLLSIIVLLAVSLCLSFLAAEFVLRKTRPVDTGKSYEFRIPHPVFGWVLQSGARYRNYLPEAAIEVAYNSEGWRDMEHSKEKPEGTMRILVLGDSFMEAYSVDLKDSFHTQAEKIMRNDGIHAEFVNMGTGGYGTLQEYLVYQEAGRRYAADIVLLGFYVSNDVTNNSMELESLLVSDKSEIHSRPFLDPDEPSEWKIVEVDFNGAQRRFDESQTSNYPLGRTLTRRSVILWILSEEVTRVVNQILSFFENSEQTVAEDEEVDRAQMDFALSGVHYCDEPPEFTRAWDITKRIFVRLKHDVESNGGRLIVFTVPSIDESSAVNEKERGNTSSHAGSVCLGAAPGYKRLHRMLGELGVDLIDLLPDFRKAAQEDNIELFRTSDKHWNPAGHALAAERVVSDLMGRKLIGR
jgi:hypothetical protein